MGLHGLIDAPPKTGAEPFRTDTEDLQFDLLSFWRWAASDVVSNTWRGLIAEYLVAQAVGAASQPRREWDAYDILTPSGLKIEVKSSGYVQSWKQKEYGRIAFGIKPRQPWDPATGEYEPEVRRCAAVYVFALHKHCDEDTLDPLNVDQWEFYVVPTARLNTAYPTQARISLSQLTALDPWRASFGDLAAAIEQAGQEHDS